MAAEATVGGLGVWKKARDKTGLVVGSKCLAARCLGDLPLVDIFTTVIQSSRDYPWLLRESQNVQESRTTNGHIVVFIPAVENHMAATT